MTVTFQQSAAIPAMIIATETATLRAVALDDLRVLRIAGADRQDFLQGQVTQDIGLIDEKHSALAGWTTAKGRLLAFGQMLPGPDSLRWLLPADVVTSVAGRLGMFILRAKVEIAVTDFAVTGLFGLKADEPLTIGPLTLGTETGAATMAGDLVAARLVGDPTRAWICGPAKQVTALRESAGFGRASNTEWQLADIAAGLPGVSAATSDTFIPQMLNLDLLGAISFKKGCYVGQEIVARTQNLGRIKRRMYRFRTTAEHLQPGASIHGPEQAVGKVVAVAPNGDCTELTAVIAIDQSAGDWYADEATRIRLERVDFPYPVA